MNTESDIPATLDYATYVPGMIAWLSNRLSAGASAEYRARFGVGVMEWRVLSHLAIEPAATAARIGRVIGLDKAAISRTVTLLLRRGLAHRVGAPARGQRLSLTAAGATLQQQILAAAMARQARLLAPLDAVEQETLRALLLRLLAQLPALDGPA